MPFSGSPSTLEKRQIMLRRFAVPLILLGLAACASPEPPPPRFPDVHFLNKPPLALDVGSVSVASNFQPSFRAPDVEHEFAVPPQRALENLGHDRFRAISPQSDHRAVFTIDDASVREVQLPLSGGVTGAVTREQAQRYDAHAAVKLEILDQNGFVERTATATATVTRSVPEGITLNDRDQVWYDMTVALAQTIDRELEQQIRSTFYPYLQ